MSFPHNNEGRKVITDMYDYETCKEIVNNGCVSGVCSQHIYYADTISFFDKYEEEVLSTVGDILGYDTLGEILTEHRGCYDAYRNDVVWTFIELVAMDVVTEMERIQYEQDQQIEDYMTQSISNNGYTLADLNESVEDLMNLSVYNPPNSMNLNRYSQV